jgi:large subunit ribosomal protein L9
MSRRLKVVLLEEVDSLGKAGDIVVVAEGYARNALFPQGKAALATEQVQYQRQRKTASQRKQTERALAARQELAEKLDGSELVVAAHVREGDELYGSITRKQIADQLNAQAHLTLRAADITLPSPIKKIGSYPVIVSLSPEVECTIQLAVVPDANNRSELEKSSSEEA